MKKAMFPILLAFVVLAGCNSKSEQVTKIVTVTVDTLIGVQRYQLQTEPRYSCSGKKLKQPKLVYYDTATVATPISITKKVPITIDCDQNSEWWPSWFYDLLKVLAAALLLWFFWWLFSQKPSSSSGTKSITESHDNDEKPGNQATATEIVAITNLVIAMGNGGGGTVSANGMYVEINGIQPPLVHIENSGHGANSGSVKVHVGDHYDGSMTDSSCHPAPGEK